MKMILFFAIALVFLSSCKKGNDESDFLVFGTYYGYCVGDCAKMFKLEQHQIFADSIDRFTGTVTFKANPLPEAKYQLAKELQDNFPNYLANKTSETFGCPDCADQGGIFLQLKKNGKTLEWNIDTDVNKQPTEIRNYISKLKSILSQL